MHSHPDAFLFAPVFSDESFRIAELAGDKGIPFALVNSNNDDIPKISYIGQDSYQSGKVAGKLIGLGLTGTVDLLVVNISRVLKNHKHILKRKTGFEAYFNELGNQHFKLHTLDIENTGQDYVNKRLSEIFNTLSGNYKGIFVTNSRVFKIASFLDDNNIRDCRLIGYDLLDENIAYLENNTIDFLISQQPYEQGYKGIITLFNHVILHKEVKLEQYLPIDIITKENIRFYIDT